MEVKSLLIQLMPATESSVNKKKGFLCVRPRLADLRLLTTVECLRLVDHQKLTHFTGHALDTRPGRCLFCALFSETSRSCSETKGTSRWFLMIKSGFEIFLLCAMFCFVVYHGFRYDMLLLFRFVRCLPFCCCCCYCCRRKNERSWMSVCCWNVWFDSLQRRLPLHRGYSTFPRSLQFILCAGVLWGQAEGAGGWRFA